MALAHAPAASLVGGYTSRREFGPVRMLNMIHNSSNLCHTRKESTMGIVINHPLNASATHGNEHMTPGTTEALDWPQLMRYIGLSQSDLTLLHKHREVINQHVDAIIDAFYAHVFQFPELRRIIERQTSLTQLKQKTVTYFRSLTEPTIDDRYVANRAHVGETHLRVGLSQEWVMTSVGQYLRLAHEHFKDLADKDLFIALMKRLVFDTTLIVGQYVLAVQRENARYRTEMGSLGARMKESIHQIAIIAENQAQASNSLAQSQETILDAMQKLHESMRAINEITRFIAEVSEQTNLLGLNASIEAAHAGDAGRSFSVVAQEIRKLAQRSQEAVQKINALTANITQQSTIVDQRLQDAAAVSEEQAAAAQELSNLIRVLNAASDQLHL